MHIFTVWKKTSGHYVWKIFLICCLFYGAVGGIITNCNGQFYQSLANTLNTSIGMITMSSAIMGACSFLVTPFLVRLYQGRHYRIIAVSAILVYTMATLGTGFVTELWQFYVLSACKGIVQGFVVFYLLSVTIKAWFISDSGFALGTSAVCAGVVGSIANIVIGYGIERYGWRITIIVSSFAAAVVALPGIVCFLYRTPQDCQREPLNSEGRKTTAGCRRENNPPAHAFWLGFFLAVILIAMYSFVQHLKTYAISVSYSPMTGSVLISLSMAGNMASKVFLGLFSDRIGVRKSAWITIVAVGTALGLLCLSTRIWTLYIAAFAIGASGSFAPVVVPQVTAEVYSGKAFEKVYSGYSTVMSVVGAFMISAIGFLYSRLQSYRPIFGMGFLMVVIGGVLLSLFLKQHGQSASA